MYIHTYTFKHSVIFCVAFILDKKINVAELVVVERLTTLLEMVNLIFETICLRRKANMKCLLLRPRFHTNIFVSHHREIVFWCCLLH